MSNEDETLRGIFEKAEDQRTAFGKSFDSNSPSFQRSLLSTIHLYERCLDIATGLALFSPNETLEDIGTGELQYLMIDYRLAESTLRLNGDNRKANLRHAQKTYERFLCRLDNYDMLSKPESKMLEHYQDSPDRFSITSMSDAAARRDAKIRRFKEEKVLKEKLEHLRSNPDMLRNDDDACRKLELLNLAYAVHQTFQSLESIAQELHILSLAPSSPPPEAAQQPSLDGRERDAGRKNTYNERLDAPLSHLSAGMRGPLLDRQGKPIRPFTLTSSRQGLQAGVFKPDHSLPTMSIDEYLEEERKRGGMIDGGGPQSGNGIQENEDDMDAADRATMKAREWDEYVEANPKGSGNTINRG